MPKPKPTFRFNNDRSVRLFHATSNRGKPWAELFQEKLYVLDIESVLADEPGALVEARAHGDAVLVYTTDIVKRYKPPGLHESLEQDIADIEDGASDMSGNRWWLIKLDGDKLWSNFAKFPFWHRLNDDQRVLREDDRGVQEQMTELAELIAGHPTCPTDDDFCPYDANTETQVRDD